MMLSKVKRLKRRVEIKTLTTRHVLILHVTITREHTRCLTSATPECNVRSEKSVTVPSRLNYGGPLGTWKVTLFTSNRHLVTVDRHLVTVDRHLRNCRSTISNCRSTLNNCRSTLSNCRSTLNNCRSTLSNCRSTLT